MGKYIRFFISTPSVMTRPEFNDCLNKLMYCTGYYISQQSPGALAAVDTTIHKAVGDRFKISGFPTVKYFEKGEEKYTLPQLRSKDKIIEYMHK